jgi:hypothetical protein
MARAEKDTKAARRAPIATLLIFLSIRDKAIHGVSPSLQVAPCGRGNKSRDEI